MNKFSLKASVFFIAIATFNTSVLAQDQPANDDRDLKCQSPMNCVAARYFEIAQDRNMPETSRVLAIQKLAEIPSEEMIGDKSLHASLLTLVNRPTETYEIRYQSIKTLFARYAGENKSAVAERQAEIVEGLSKCARNRRTEETLRKYILNNLIYIAAEKLPSEN